jgi:hypothetical protein
MGGVTPMKSFAWSYSVLTRFEQCPKKYYHLNVLKDFKDADTEQSNEGKQIHEALCKRVIDGAPLPLPFRHFEPIAKKFAVAEGEKYGEMKLALNRSYEQRSWFDKDVFVRAIVDLLIVRPPVAIIVDWKTGKVRDDFSQLKLTAAVLSQIMPEIETFQTMFVWLASRNISPKTFEKEELLEVWNELLPRAAKIESAISTTSFPARPSPLCRYCPVTACPHFEKR